VDRAKFFLALKGRLKAAVVEIVSIAVLIVMAVSQRLPLRRVGVSEIGILWDHVGEDIRLSHPQLILWEHVTNIRYWEVQTDFGPVPLRGWPSKARSYLMENWAEMKANRKDPPGEPIQTRKTTEETTVIVYEIQ